MNACLPASEHESIQTAACGEFALIERYFRRPHRHTLLGGGDDAALLCPAFGQNLAVTSDTLVEGRHFFSDVDAETLGWKAMAVNLSDLAAMGATPRWATLALTLPQARATDDVWLTAFARGLYACADAFAVDLVGGDTTCGPLTITLTLIGEVPIDTALRRAGGQADDDLWLSGAPGLAALGLAHTTGRATLADDTVRARCLDALHRPQPRVALGLALRDLAHAAIDVSDGVLADLRHLARASGLRATVQLSALPAAVFACGVSDAVAQRCLLAGGDDYELIFAAPASVREAIISKAVQLDVPLARIGSLSAGTVGAVRVLDKTGEAVAIPAWGFDHFATS